MKTGRMDKARKAFWQSGTILFIAAITGFVFNQARSDDLPLMTDWSPEARLTINAGQTMIISLEKARRLCKDKKVIFVDARSSELYDQGHIRCAQNIPWQSFDEYVDRVFDTIPDNALIVTYCDGEQCSLSEDLARELVSMGYERVKVLLNGWTRWLEAGFPIEQG